MRRTGLIVLLAAGAIVAVGARTGEVAALTASHPARVTDAVAPAAEPSSAAELTRVDLVVIGDSLIGVSPTKCQAGCAGFVHQYSDILADVFGVTTYSYSKVHADGVPEAAQIATENDHWRPTIAGAEVVVVEVGYNNALPDPATGIGCAGSFGIDWILSTQPECLDEGVATYGELYDQLFARIKELRAGQPTVFVAMTTINGNIEASAPDGLIALAGDRADEVKAWIVAAYDRWNAMLTERAEAAGFVVVDLYHAFNGPDGSLPPGSLFEDVADLSRAGDDLIAAMLADVDLTALGA
jgi:hypothetical protein